MSYTFARGYERERYIGAWMDGVGDSARGDSRREGIAPDITSAIVAGALEQ